MKEFFFGISTGKEWPRDANEVASNKYYNINKLCMLQYESHTTFCALMVIC